MAVRTKYARTAVLSTVLTNTGFIMNLIYGKILATIVPDVYMGIIAALNIITTLIVGLSTFGVLYTITQKAPSSIGKGTSEKASSIIWKGSLVFYSTALPFSIILLYVFLVTQNLLVWILPMSIFITLSLVKKAQRTTMDSMIEPDKGVLFTGLYRWAQWGMSLGFLFLLITLFIPDFYTGIIIGWVTSTVIFTIIGFLIVVRYFRGSKISLGLPVSTYLTFGLPVFGAYVVRLIGQQIDKLYIMYTSALTDPAILANYFFAARITSALNEFSFSLTTGLVALLAMLFGINLTRMQRAHTAIIRFILLITTPFYFAVAAFGEPVVVFLLDPQYYGISAFLPFLSFAYYFELIIVVLMMGRKASGQRRIIPIVWASLLTLKLGLLLLLGNDLLGVTIAVLVSNIILAIIVALYLRREIHLGSFWMKLCIPALILLSVGFLSKWLVLDVILSFIVCLISLLITILICLRLHILTIEDMQIIRSAIPQKLMRIVDVLAKIGGYPSSSSSEGVKEE